MTRHARFGALCALLLAFSLLPAVAGAAPSSNACLNRNLNTTTKLLSCVDADDVFVHLAAFQAIADANGGTRASGTPGYDASADYVADLLEAAGFDVERQVFDFSLFSENSSSLTADGVPIETQTMSFSGSGDLPEEEILARAAEAAEREGRTPEEFLSDVLSTVMLFLLFVAGEHLEPGVHQALHSRVKSMVSSG